MRLGSRLNRSGPKPMRPNTSPVVAKVSATGMPASSSTKKLTSITMASTSLSGIGAASPCKEILDRLRQRLQEQQGEADGDESLEQIAGGNAAGIGGPFTDNPGLHHIGPG